MSRRHPRKKRRPQTRVKFEALESRALLHGEGMLSGYVYLDTDANGLRDEGEFGVPGIVVSLSDGDTSDASSARTVLTDDRGFYSFDELEPGNYEVSERQSPALVDGDDSTPMPEAVSTNDLFANVVLADDQNSEENNFGEQGLQAEFINVHWFLASTPPPQQMLRETIALAEDLDGDPALAESIRAGGSDIPDTTPDPPLDTNARPVAMDDAYTVEENNELSVPLPSGVLANDTDPDGDTLTASLIDQATNGSVTLNSDGSFTYTPEDNFSGDDTFTYSASDGEATATANVAVTVTPAPENTFTIDENSPVGTVVGQIEPEGDPTDSLIFEFDDPNVADTFQLDREIGELTVADSSALDFETTPSFAFTVNVTNGSTSTVDATVNLRNVNEAGPIAQDDTYQVDEDNDLNASIGTGVLSNDSDADGDALTATVVDQPDNGSLILNDDGSFTYGPDDNFAGTDQFTYETTDGEFSDNATATIVVNSVNDVPVANANVYATDQDVVLTVNTANGVLANDTDADGDSLTAVLVAEPGGGAVDLDDDGSFVYTPDTGFSGSDSFTYRADDTTATSNIGTVTVNVNPSNRPPVASNDDYSVGENGVLSVGPRHNLLVNDTDPDGDTLTAGLVDQANNGVVDLNPDGTFTYTPNNDFSGDDAFTYRANDASETSNVATASITVTPAGDGNELFGAVTPGAFDDPNLLGIRTDQQPGAPPISAQHVDAAANYDGFSNPPTYGPHHGVIRDSQGNSITPRPTGVYDTEQPEEDLVHNLEHGHVWISYNPNLLSSEDQSLLAQLVTDGGTDTGVILTPRSENTTAIALASWAHLQTLDSFDAAQIRDFIETNRGHTPEGFIPSGQKGTTGASETLDDGLMHGETLNQPFAPVTPGSIDDPELLGTRMDTQPSAAPFTLDHTSEAVDYRGFGNPPSYGPHHGVIRDAQGNFITPRPTGFYDTEQPDEDLVHNLEHGHVWISYNPSLIDNDTHLALEQFVTDGGTDTGVILTPRSENTSPIVLTSLTRQLTLNSFDAETIRDFVNTNRGHSPEGFIPSGQKPADGESLDDGLPHTP